MDSYREQLEKSLGMSMAVESDANTSISSTTGILFVNYEYIAERIIIRY